MYNILNNLPLIALLHESCTQIFISIPKYIFYYNICIFLISQSSFLIESSESSISDNDYETPYNIEPKMNADICPIVFHTSMFVPIEMYLSLNMKKAKLFFFLIEFIKRNPNMNIRVSLRFIIKMLSLLLLKLAVNSVHLL